MNGNMRVRQDSLLSFTCNMIDLTAAMNRMSHTLSSSFILLPAARVLSITIPVLLKDTCILFVDSASLFYKSFTRGGKQTPNSNQWYYFLKWINRHYY